DHGEPSGEPPGAPLVHHLCTKEAHSARNKNAKPRVIHDLAFGAETGAERTGFEPADPLRGHGFSKPALSTAQPPLRSFVSPTWGLGLSCGRGRGGPTHDRRR